MMKLNPKWEETASSLFRRSVEAPDKRLRERFLALGLVALGQSVQDVAGYIQRRRQTISDWVHRFNESGPEGLQPEFRSPSVPYLNEDEFRILSEILIHPPHKNGFAGERWVGEQVTILIQERFGRHVHPETARRYLHRCLTDRKDTDEGLLDQNLIK